MNRIQSTTQKWIQKGRIVWIKAKHGIYNPMQDAFLEAKVFDILKKQILVNLRLTNEAVEAYDTKPISVAYSECLKLTYAATDVPDMVDLQQLNQPQLLFNLKRRYMNDVIFTYCGPTLVIINPYAYIQKAFNESVMLEYQTNVFLDTLQYKTLPPHIFALAAFCLWQLFQNQRNQSIVISGQSGAGKTQNTKYCLKFLASLGKNMKGMINQNKSSKFINAQLVKSVIKRNNVKLQGIEDKILGCNQILQAFGNSKTIRNDNSSRFGKLILLLYGETQIDIKSAFIISYLLQKSRIVSVSDGQRNYHVFYYFLKGLSQQERNLYHITNQIHEYRYLNQSSVYDINGVSDKSKYTQLLTEFGYYFDNYQCVSIFKLLSAILNIGNVVFKKDYTANNEQMAVITNKEYIKNVSILLQVEYFQLQHSFQFKTRKTGLSVINSPLKYDQAVALRDSFAKNIYEKIFNFLVKKLNQKIELEKINLQQNSKGFRKSLGLLDIFGFEVLQSNSLEQFLINFANQKLQQLYVSYIFKEQQNQFKSQGLKQFAHEIDFQDNKPVIDLMEAFPLGLFHLINQSSELNKADDDLPNSIAKNHPKNIFVSIPKSKKGIFLINHSCSPVNYNTNGFTSRNKDQFPQQLLEFISNTNNHVIKQIIIGEVTQNTNKNRAANRKFLGTKFLNEMNKLIQELYSSDCHFVRCIKPNSKKSPKMYDSEAVLQSLRYLGVLDSIIIRKLGYIYRRSYRQFLKKFFELEQYIYNYNKFIENKTDDDIKQQVKKLVAKYASRQEQARQILIGHKKILIKESALNHLEALAKEKRKLRIQSANKINHMYKTSTFRMQVTKFMATIKSLKSQLTNILTQVRIKIFTKKCLKIQNIIKKYLLEKRLEKIKQQATKIVTKVSSIVKMKKQRKIYQGIRHKIIRIQANIKSYLAMAQFFRVKDCRLIAMQLYEEAWIKIETKNAILIQKIWRGYSIRNKYKKVFEQITKKLRLAKYKAKLLKAIFAHRYQKYIQHINRYLRPIIKMQALARGRSARKMFLLMRKSASIIQKAYRRHLRKKYYLSRLWKDYRKNIYYEEKLKLKQLQRLGLKIIRPDNLKKYAETIAVVTQLYPNELLYKYSNVASKVQESQLKVNWQINETIQFNDKNTFQLYIADYDLMGSQYYQGKWLVKYGETKQQMKRKNEYPIHLSLANDFTTVVSNKDKVYLFYNEQNKMSNEKIELGGIPNQIISSQDYAYLLLNNKKMYCWGFNYQNCLQVSQQNLNYVPFVQHPKLTNLHITQMSCRGKNKYFVDIYDKVHYFSINQNKTIMRVVDFGIKASIKLVSASLNFVHFITANGLLYSQGKNKKGELGLGFCSKDVMIPQLNQFFKNNKQSLQIISVGLSHTIAKSKLGYVYTWGNNCYQQVSPSSLGIIDTPTIIQTEDSHKMKAFQVAAGARSTYILTDQLKIIAFGTSSCFPLLKSAAYLPLQLFKETSTNKNLIEIKMRAHWTTQFSILTVNAIDLNKCKIGTKSDVILKYAKMIGKEWITDQIYPPYHQWTDNILQLSDLRRFKFLSTNKDQHNQINELKSKPEKNQNLIELDELKALMDLRKTSTIFKTAARKKMEQIIIKLNSKPLQKWEDTDRILNSYIKQNSHILR